MLSRSNLSRKRGLFRELNIAYIVYTQPTVLTFLYKFIKSMCAAVSNSVLSAVDMNVKLQIIQNEESHFDIFEENCITILVH